MFYIKDSKLDFNNILVKTTSNKVDKEKFKTIIPITNDNMFKALFGREENIKFTCKLLSYLINIDYEVLLKNLKFTKNETGKKYKKEIAYRNDLVVKIDDITINVEMNNNGSEEIRERNMSYLYRLREDKKRDEDYKNVIQINLNNFSYENDLTIRRDSAFISDDNKIMLKSIISIDIYLPNIKIKCYNEGVESLNELEKFLLIGIEEDRAKRDGYEAGLEDGLKDGVERGKVQGIVQGENNIIKKFLDSNMSVEEISKITGISEVEILAIKES